MKFGFDLELELKVDKPEELEGRPVDTDDSKGVSTTSGWFNCEIGGELEMELMLKWTPFALWLVEGDDSKGLGTTRGGSLSAITGIASVTGREIEGGGKWWSTNPLLLE
jgi:hypothetical protein